MVANILTRYVFVYIIFNLLLHYMITQSLLKKNSEIIADLEFPYNDLSSERKLELQKSTKRLLSRVFLVIQQKALKGVKL